MKRIIIVLFLVFILPNLALSVGLDKNSNYTKLKNFKPDGVNNEQCLNCHKATDKGLVADWEHSKHAKAKVGCVECHVVPKNYPTAFKDHPFKGSNWTVAAAVSSVTCAKCHSKEVKEFLQSGHARAAAQWRKENKNPHGIAMTKLAVNYEGAAGGKDLCYSFNKNSLLKHTSEENGCMQCHGSIVKLDKSGKPTTQTWPNDGIASLYPDGGVGNCVSCHSRHKFSSAEARNPAACTNCHLGPDHPDKEIFESSVHGHIFHSNDASYKFDTHMLQPGKTLRGPVCVTCHMSGFNGLTSTHNVSERLKWNLWAPKSALRNSKDETAGFAWWNSSKVLRGNPKAGNPNGAEAARTQMKQVCSSCHQANFIKNYFERVDNAVNLYNQYYDVAAKMLSELKKKGLIKKDVWSDPFFKLYYYLWHHEGRRFRQGAAMGSPDYAHWHGVFQVMQDIREMKSIYDYRMKMLKKLKNAQKVLEEEPPMPVVTHE